MTLISRFVRLSSIALLALSGCGDSPSSTAKPPAAATTSLPAGLLTTSEPVGALKVIEARASAKSGERVVIIGRIGGSRNPFVKNRGIFTIVDPTLQSCVEMGDPDHCPRPWDYCCEDKSTLKNGMATIELLGADGKPLAMSLDVTGDLKSLMLVAVEGTLLPSQGESFVVRADKIYKFPSDPLAKYIK